MPNQGSVDHVGAGRRSGQLDAGLWAGRGLKIARRRAGRGPRGPRRGPTRDALRALRFTRRGVAGGGAGRARGQGGLAEGLAHRGAGPALYSALQRSSSALTAEQSGPIYCVGPPPRPGGGWWPGVATLGVHVAQRPVHRRALANETTASTSLRRRTERGAPKRDDDLISLPG